MTEKYYTDHDLNGYVMHWKLVFNDLNETSDLKDFLVMMDPTEAMVLMESSELD